MPERIGFGVIGCGTIAYWTHLRILRALPSARLVAAADPDASARERARSLGPLDLYEKPSDLLARDDVQAVIVAAAPAAHAELACLACAAGKHVYVEKPFATEAADGRRVVEAAERAGVRVVVGFNRRLHPAHEQARALVAKGALGQVRAVRTAFCEPTTVDVMPAWKRQRASGGGVLLDLGVHHFDLVRWLLSDEVAAVEARLGSEASEHDSAVLRMNTRGGVDVQSFFSFRVGPSDSLELYGERGTLLVDRHRPVLDWRVPRRFGYGVRRRWLPPRPRDVGWRLHRALRPSWEPSYRRALEAFVTLVRMPSRPSSGLAELADGVRALEVVLGAETAAREGRRVDLQGS